MKGNKSNHISTKKKLPYSSGEDPVLIKPDPDPTPNNLFTGKVFWIYPNNWWFQSIKDTTNFPRNFQVRVGFGLF